MNDTEPSKVMAIVTSVIEAGAWDEDAPPVIIASDYAITGSHRIDAAGKLSILGYGEYTVLVVDATEEVDLYCEENECTIDTLPYDDLSKIFKGTEVEEEAKRNEEW